MDRAYTLKGSFDVFKSRLVTLRLRCGLATRVLDKELDIVHVPVVQTLDSAIHGIDLYPLDNTIGFPSTYPLDSDLSGG